MISTSRPALSINVTLFRSRTSFFLPEASRLFTFSLSAMVSAPNTIRPSSASTTTSSTPRLVIFRPMLFSLPHRKIIAESTRAGLDIHPSNLCHESSDWKGVYTYSLAHRLVQVYLVRQSSSLQFLQDARDSYEAFPFAFAHLVHRRSVTHPAVPPFVVTVQWFVTPTKRKSSAGVGRKLRNRQRVRSASSP